MSKSKKNVVDPDEIVDRYGADAVRWFMLSDSPPERDLPWSEAGIEGCGRFVQRLWRLFGQYDAAATGEDKALARKTHQAIAAVGEDIEALAFNKAVARIYELTTAAEKAAPSADRSAAIRTVLLLAAPMMPHLAEEGWAAMGETGPGRRGRLARGRSGAAGRGRGDHRGPGQGQAARHADRRQGPAEARARGACAGQREGPACARWSGGPQGDRGARPAGQHRRMKVLAALAGAARRAGRCGLQPMYAGGGSGAVAQGLAAVEVGMRRRRPGGARGLAAIEVRRRSRARPAGWCATRCATGSAQSGQHGAPRYRLDVLLDDELEGLGLLTDETVGRERRTLRARYQLVDLATGDDRASTPPPARTRASTWSPPNSPPSPPSRPRSRTSRVEVADRIVTRLALALRAGTA